VAVAHVAVPDPTLSAPAALGTTPHPQGFAVQSYVTGEGPYQNWVKHVADPFGYNLLTVLGAEERTPTL
jgi:hypothetical protein